MRTRYLVDGVDVKENVNFIPNYVLEIGFDEDGIETNVVRELSPEEYIENVTCPCASGLVVNGVAFNPDNLSRLQACDELERRIDNIEISKSE